MHGATTKFICQSCLTCQGGALSVGTQQCMTCVAKLHAVVNNINISSVEQQCFCGELCRRQEQRGHSSARKVTEYFVRF